jgi:hypothetical protein
MTQSVGMMIPNIWKNKIHVPNHPPVTEFWICLRNFTQKWNFGVPDSQSQGGFSRSVDLPVPRGKSTKWLSSRSMDQWI